MFVSSHSTVLPRLGNFRAAPYLKYLALLASNSNPIRSQAWLYTSHRSDYLPVNEVLVFGPFAKSREVSVEIVDDNQWEPDEEFFLRLSIIDEDCERDDVALGRLSIMEIVILDDDGKLKYFQYEVQAVQYMVYDKYCPNCRAGSHWIPKTRDTG